MITEEVTQAQIKDLEKFADRLLNKFNVDVEFTKHFADRMNDDRNNPPIKISELQAFFKKIAKAKAKNIKAHPNSQVVLKDMQKDLNLPVVIDLDDKGEVEVTHKTIMRKKNFSTPNPVVQYEEAELEEGSIKGNSDSRKANLKRAFRAGRAKATAVFSRSDEPGKSARKLRKSIDTSDKGQNQAFKAGNSERHVIRGMSSGHNSLKKYKGSIEKRRKALGTMPKPNLPEETDITEEQIGKNGSVGIHVVSSKDKVTKKPSRNVVMKGAGKTVKLIHGVDPKWNNSDIVTHLKKVHGSKLHGFTFGEETDITEASEMVKIHSPGHPLHGRTGKVFHKFDDGRVNAQVTVNRGRRGAQVHNLTLKPHQYKSMSEEVDINEARKTKTRTLPPDYLTLQKRNALLAKHGYYHSGDKSEKGLEYSSTAGGAYHINMQGSNGPGKYFGTWSHSSIKGTRSLHDGSLQKHLEKLHGKVNEEVDINEAFTLLVNPLSESAQFSLYQKAETSGYSKEILETVYARGLAAYDEKKHRKYLPEQYAFARVNSFIKGGKARLMDADLVETRRTFKEWTLENPEDKWHSTKNQRVIPLKQKNGMYHPHDIKDTEMLRAVTGKHVLSPADLKYAHGAAHRQGYKLDVKNDK